MKTCAASVIVMTVFLSCSPPTSPSQDIENSERREVGSGDWPGDVGGSMEPMYGRGIPNPEGLILWAAVAPLLLPDMAAPDASNPACFQRIESMWGTGKPTATAVYAEVSVVSCLEDESRPFVPLSIAGPTMRVQTCTSFTFRTDGTPPAWMSPCVLWYEALAPDNATPIYSGAMAARPPWIGDYLLMAASSLEITVVNTATVPEPLQRAVWWRIGDWIGTSISMEQQKPQVLRLQRGSTILSGNIRYRVIHVGTHQVLLSCE